MLLMRRYEAFFREELATRTSAERAASELKTWTEVVGALLLS